MQPHGYGGEYGRDGAQHGGDHRGGAHGVHNGLYLVHVQPILEGIDVDAGHGVADPQRGENGQKGPGRHEHGQRQEQGRGAHGLQSVQRRVIGQRRPLKRTGANGAVGDIAAAFWTNHFETLQDIYCLLKVLQNIYYIIATENASTHIIPKSPKKYKLLLDKRPKT